MSESNESCDRITTKAEEIIAKSVMAILELMATGERVHESAESRNVLSALESFIPEVFGEVHSEWMHVSLDGVFPLIAEKTGVRAMRIFGQCILISDQTTVHFQVELQVNPSGDRVTWLECKLGEKGRTGMIRTPYRSPTKRIKLLHSLDGKRDLFDWAYLVTFGERAD